MSVSIRPRLARAVLALVVAAALAAPAAAQYRDGSRTVAYHGCFAGLGCFALEDRRIAFETPHGLDAWLDVSVAPTSFLRVPGMVELAGHDSPFLCCSAYEVGALPPSPLRWAEVRYSEMRLGAFLWGAPPSYTLEVFTPRPGVTPPAGAPDLRPYSGLHLVTVHATPEPATLALVAGGLALVGVVARRRRAA